MRWLLLWSETSPDDGTTFEKDEVRQNFAKALLMASDLWSRRAFSSWSTFGEDLEADRRRSLPGVLAGVEGSDVTPSLDKSLGRGWIIFDEYLPKYYPSFKAAFQSATGLTLAEFYSCVAMVIVNFLNPIRGTGIFSAVDFRNANTIYESAPSTEIIEKYLEVHSIDSERLRRAFWGDNVERADEFDDQNQTPPLKYRPLRQKPLLKVADGRSIVLDPIIYSDSASVGPLFMISSNRRDEALRAFGSAFEDYILDMLERMFPMANAVLHKRFCRDVDLPDGTKSLQVDGVLNDLSELVVFEVKAGFLTEESTTGKDPEAFLGELREKYVRKSDGTEKGVGQLARRTKIIADVGWDDLDVSLAQLKRIYPVLIVSDTRLSAPIIGEVLASEFVQYFDLKQPPRIGGFTIGDVRVDLPIIMTVDDLENLEVSVEKIGFRDLLAAYSTACPDRNSSLLNYMAISEYSSVLRRNRNTAEGALAVLDLIRANSSTESA
ncbi:hypothetical protein ACFLU6_04660 [Acidobacteriota bacterium]